MTKKRGLSPSMTVHRRVMGKVEAKSEGDREKDGRVKRKGI